MATICALLRMNNKGVNIELTMKGLGRPPWRKTIEFKVFT